MNRPKQGTSSNNSGTSSETSETQSVDDQQSAPQSNIRAGSSASLSRAKNSWRRMKELAAEKEKENEAKRPPWRAVSVSTLTKPDKSALLRAKLLDASRRLRAGKANVALQTDFVPTKLMKEASFGVQKDLILHKDIGILTDGQYSKKKDGYEKYVLTYSMSQMTDSVPTVSRQTQTLLPKAYNKDLVNSYLPETDEDGTELISDVEKRLGDQIAKIRGLNFDESQQTRASGNNTNLAPTLASWQFDDDAVEMESERHFIPYTIESFRPWRSFVPFPFRLRGNSLIGAQKIDWYALLQSIDDLIKESNNLVDKLEHIMLENRAHRKSVLGNLGKIPKFESTRFSAPSEQWLPLIEQQEKQLQIILTGSEAHKESSISSPKNG
ncbi:uncharacterized protein LOC108031559 [Drosophila biarmipes]|uniref:uncharacterized protein LOC108031559 n=1 Tax=Drosophila biarmipes TaxID=125945 RepID=UPI0007E70FEB|nr:uncharacterized protein LOC108031559 [Drosophila biarmipes]